MILSQVANLAYQFTKIGGRKEGSFAFTYFSSECKRK